MPEKPPMSLSAVQETVDAWIGGFQEGYFDPMAMVVRLSEELGELAREVNHTYGPKPKKASEPPGSVAEEIGDMLFVLVCLANSLHLNLEDVFAEVMDKYRSRDGRRWTPKSPGVTHAQHQK